MPPSRREPSANRALGYSSLPCLVPRHEAELFLGNFGAKLIPPRHPDPQLVFIGEDSDIPGQYSDEKRPGFATEWGTVAHEVPSKPFV
jgi:hypothetical protein